MFQRPNQELAQSSRLSSERSELVSQDFDSNKKVLFEERLLFWLRAWV